MLRTYVGFVADFPTESGSPHVPAGAELALYLQAALGERGIRASHPENLGDYSWAMRVADAPVGATITVGLVGDMDSDPPRQWLVTTDPRPSLLQRLLGGGAARQGGRETVERVVGALHAALGSDPSFDHVRWHRADTFDQPGDEPAKSP